MADSLREKCRDLIDRIQGLLDQGWFYTGSPPGRGLSERRVTECSDLLGLVAELCGDCQKMADALEQLLLEAAELDVTPDQLRKVVGVDLVSLGAMHNALAHDLAAAGSRALDMIGDSDGKKQRRLEATDP